MQQPGSEYQRADILFRKEDMEMEVIEKPRWGWGVPESLCPPFYPEIWCGIPVICGRELYRGIEAELTEVCAIKFFDACGKFGDIVGPRCPFDPVPKARFHRLAARIDELQAQVEELMARK